MSIETGLRKLTIRTRMWMVLAIVIITMLVVSGTGIAGQFYAHQTGVSIVEGELAGIKKIMDLRMSMATLRQHEKDMIIYYGKPAETRKAIKDWETTFEKAVGQAQELMIALASPSQKAKVADCVAHLREFKKKFAAVARMLDSQGFDSQDGAAIFMSRAQVEYNTAHEVIESVAVDLESSAAQAGQRLQSVGNLVQMVLLIATAIGLLLIGIANVLNIRSIARPILAAEQLATEIANGNLTAIEVDTRGQDEAGALLRALSQMRSNLRRLVGEVRISSDGVLIASGEIAAGNLDLSTRTENAAANLQETASSMEQLTSTIQQSTEAVNEANGLAIQAANVSQRGSKVVSQAMEKMSEINDSAKKIATIIGVIDGIAFQTNILALNAAVEAARAGDQGRGFAVVAAEVRNLAQRSARAAQEIKALINNSVDGVESGTRLVSEAGRTMTEITESVRRVTSFIGEFATASMEQRDGIQQVNSAVSHLDQLTQQNAALVEQSAAAAASLEGQARALAQVVSVFRLDSQEH